MKKSHYDFIVLGGGSGGIAAARRAAEYGVRVALFEPARLGGTCVNVGCVPKKVMWNAAQISDAIDLAAEYGFSVSTNGLDWGALKRGRDAYVRRLNAIYADNLRRAKVEVIPHSARFCAPKSVQADGKTYTAQHILIATGGRPTELRIPGSELAITSDGFFELAQQPRRPLIIGSGYIATELAGLLHALGSQVTMLLRGDRLLRAFEPMLGETVLAQMQQNGVEIRTNTQAAAVLRSENGELAYRTANGDTQGGFDALITAISRTPNSESLGLEKAEISADERGFIEVDGFQNTQAAGIYALGDITPAPALTPVAIAAARCLADRLFGDQPDAHLQYDNIPTVVFSHPPIASVGLSSVAAAAAYGAENLRYYQSQFTNMRYALSEDKPPTIMKLITAGAEQKIVGCHIVGDAADEMLQGFAVAIKMGATKADFDRTIAIHPTAAEELVTMR